MRDPSYDMPFDPTGDITGGTSRPTQRPSSVRRTSRPGQRGAAGRDMPAAVSTGLVLLAVFIGAIMWRPAAVMLIVVAVLGLAAVEFFNKVTEKGYRPATFAGIAASVCAPLAAYWRGSTGLVLVLALAFMATTIGFVGSGSVQSGPMPNTAISSLAFVWIGLLGSFAAMILHMSVDGAYPVHTGTDTLFILVAGVVANDVGALFAGSAMGRTPLRDWISPNKTVEGAVGGLLATIVVVFVMGGANGTWDTTKELLLLSIIISIFAPLGDLVESMFKRNLDVKDFGTIVAGHGGILDRFDGFLFVLPSVYYLTLVLEPWVK
jgi:phosphatidate cytidylyltransferase